MQILFLICPAPHMLRPEERQSGRRVTTRAVAITRLTGQSHFPLTAKRDLTIMHSCPVRFAQGAWVVRAARVRPRWLLPSATGVTQPFRVVIHARGNEVLLAGPVEM